MQGKLESTRLDLFQVVDHHHRHLVVVVVFEPGHAKASFAEKPDKKIVRVVFLQPERPG